MGAPLNPSVQLSVARLFPSWLLLSSPIARSRTCRVDTNRCDVAGFLLRTGRYSAVRHLMTPSDRSRQAIGFHAEPGHPLRTSPTFCASHLAPRLLGLLPAVSCRLPAAARMVSRPTVTLSLCNIMLLRHVIRGFGVDVASRISRSWIAAKIWPTFDGSSRNGCRGLGVIYGRRRCGKPRLPLEAVSAGCVAYYVAGDEVGVRS